jgi:hypothetical protein
MHLLEDEDNVVVNNSSVATPEPNTLYYSASLRWLFFAGSAACSRRALHKSLHPRRNSSNVNSVCRRGGSALTVVIWRENGATLIYCYLNVNQYINKLTRLRVRSRGCRDGCRPPCRRGFNCRMAFADHDYAKIAIAEPSTSDADQPTVTPQAASKILSVRTLPLIEQYLAQSERRLHLQTCGSPKQDLRFQVISHRPNLADRLLFGHAWSWPSTSCG